MQRQASLLWSLLLVGVLLLAYANQCLAEPEKNTGQVKITLPFAKENLSIEKKGEYDRVSLKDANLPLDEPGTPLLPASFVNVRVPDGAKVILVSVNVLKETLIAKNLKVYPVQPSVRGHQPAPEFVKPNAQAYKSTLKKELGKGAQAQQMREYTFVPVRVNPVRLIAATGELYLAETVEITVEFKTNPQAARAKAKRKDDPFENMMKKLVVNPDISFKSSDGEAPAPSSSEPIPSVEPAPEPAIESILLPAATEYLIITSSDFVASFQALADHRAAFNGVTTKILATSTIYSNYAGIDNQQKIRACIKDYVTNRGTQYVVLGGHSGKVPARNLNLAGASYPGYAIPSDLYYAGLDGTWDETNSNGCYGEEFIAGAEGDLMADVFLGRLPLGSTAQVNQYINKLIKYEKTPPLGIEKKLMINGTVADSKYTGDNRPSDVMNDGHLAFRDANHPTVSDSEMWMRRLFRDCVQSHGWQASQFGVLMDTLTSWDSTTGGSYTANGTNMETRFNEGWNFVFNSTHGYYDLLGGESGDFYQAQAARLTGLTAIFVSDACRAARWNASNSVSISMLANPNGGALAYLGHTHDNSYTSDSAPASNTSTGGVADDYPRAFADVVFRDRAPYLGDAFVAHQLKMNAIASVLPAPQNSYHHNMYRETMYGISLLGDPLLAVRTEVTRPLVATHPTFVKPNQAFVVRITRDGLPVKSSAVRIWNASQRYETVTDLNGNASFTLSNVSTNEMTVVACAPNSIPYQGKLYVQLDATPLVLVTATDAAASETLPNPGTWTFNRSDNLASSQTIYFSLGGTATQGSDYTVPNVSSLTFPAGAASAVLTLTPVDDSVYAEYSETAILTLLPNSGYVIAGSAAATISIADNDNMPPSVNASQDQIAYVKTVPWTPLELSPGLWLDASKATINAGTVSMTNAGTGGGTVSGPASLTANGIGNLQAVQFSGVSQYLTGAYTNTSNTLSAFFVGKSASTTQTAYAGMMSVWASGQANEFNNVGSAVLFNQNNATANSVYTYRNSTSLSATTGTLTNAFVAATVFSGSTNTMFLNGKAANVANSSGNFSASNVVLGSRRENSSFVRGWNGSMGEAIIFNASLSEDNRQKTEGYLAHKWGSVASLPAGHAYLNAAPTIDRGTVQLNGTASDLENAPLTIGWSMVSGPGTVTFSNAAAASTQATFTVEGVYTLRLSANDGTTLMTDDVVITVKKSNFPVGKVIGFETAEGYPSAGTQIASVHSASTNAPFDGIKGWSRSTSSSVSRAAATTSSGEYTGGQALGTDGSGTYIGGVKGVILPDELSTITFDAQYSSGIAVGFMKDADGDGLFEPAEVGMAFGVGGATTSFQRRNAAFGTETASPLAGTTGQWYRFKVTIGPSVVGSRAVTMEVRNLTTSIDLDFETTPAGVQSWSFSVTDAAFGPAPENADGVFVRLTAAAKIDNLVMTAAQPSSVGIVDADTDGIDDSWETAQFGGIGASDGSRDFDGDGSCDLHEFQAGTDPKDSTSLLKTVSLTKTTASEMVLTFNAVEGKTYKVLASSDLTTSSWQPIQTGIIGVSPTTSVMVPIDNATKFFIIGVE